MGLGGWEIFLIFLIVLLVFGAKRLPEIANSMGKAVNEFKRAKDEVVNTAPARTQQSTKPDAIESKDESPKDS